MITDELVSSMTVPFMALGSRAFYSVRLTEYEAQDLCEEWQKVLGLRDWAVRVVVERASEFENKGARAEISDNPHSKVALLKLLDPEDFPEDSILPHDMELSLVHELLHIHLNKLRVPKEFATVEEEIIESIAEALVTAKRTSNIG